MIHTGNESLPSPPLGVARLSLLLALLTWLPYGALGAAVTIVVADSSSSFAVPDPIEPKHLITLAAKGSGAAASASGSGSGSTGGRQADAQEPPILGATSGATRTGRRRVVMTAADGRRYSCSLGGLFAGSGSGGGTDGSGSGGGGGGSVGSSGGGGGGGGDGGSGSAVGSALEESGRAAASAGRAASPFDLLEKLSSTCLYRQEGLWTYEVCYKKQVRQFRQEAVGKAEDFSCGKYAGDEAQDESLKSDASSHPTPIRYVSLVFTGGAECIMTGGPRSAEVRFTCLPDTTDNAIVSIREFPTCNYVMTVSTPFLCRHPDFAPPPETRIHTECEELED